MEVLEKKKSCFHQKAESLCSQDSVTRHVHFDAETQIRPISPKEDSGDYVDPFELYCQREFLRLSGRIAHHFHPNPDLMDDYDSEGDDELHQNGCSGKKSDTNGIVRSSSEEKHNFRTDIGFPDDVQNSTVSAFLHNTKFGAERHLLDSKDDVITEEEEESVEVSEGNAVFPKSISDANGNNSKECYGVCGRLAQLDSEGNCCMSNGPEKLNPHDKRSIGYDSKPRRKNAVIHRERAFDVPDASPSDVMRIMSDSMTRFSVNGSVESSSSKGRTSNPNGPKESATFTSDSLVPKKDHLVRENKERNARSVSESNAKATSKSSGLTAPAVLNKEPSEQTSSHYLSAEKTRRNDYKDDKSTLRKERPTLPLPKESVTTTEKVSGKEAQEWKQTEASSPHCASLSEPLTKLAKPTESSKLKTTSKHKMESKKSLPALDISHKGFSLLRRSESSKTSRDPRETESKAAVRKDRSMPRADTQPEKHDRKASDLLGRSHSRKGSSETKPVELRERSVSKVEIKGKSSKRQCSADLTPAKPKLSSQFSTLSRTRELLGSHGFSTRKEKTSTLLREERNSKEGTPDSVRSSPLRKSKTMERKKKAPPKKESIDHFTKDDCVQSNLITARRSMSVSTNAASRTA